MKLGFLLHFYQPPTQTDAALKAVVSECYIPLLKLIKANASARFSVNLPLSLLELLEARGYVDILSQIRELYEAEKIEITGSAAYHPLLTKISSDLASKQIVLNEYSLGYYFGQHQGFEGELSMMIKDIKGFFSPELAVDDKLISLLDNLKYEWAVVGPCALSKNQELLDRGQRVFRFKNHEIKLVTRDTTLSNLLSFKRNADVDDALDYLSKVDDPDLEVVVALDGEVFGHHNKEGIYLFDLLLEKIDEAGIKVQTVSGILSESEAVQVDEINECTWSTDVENPGEKYPLWENPENEIQNELWELNKIVCKEFSGKSAPHIDEGYGNIATWKPSEVVKITNKKAQDFLKTEILFYKSMHSDQFWWASGKTVYDKLLHSPQMVENALAIYKELSESPMFSNIKDRIGTLSDDIKRQLYK